MRKYAKFGVLIAIIVGSIAWVATATVQSSKTYYVTITELTKMGNQTSKRVRVGGDVQEHVAAVQEQEAVVLGGESVVGVLRHLGLSRRPGAAGR